MAKRFGYDEPRTYLDVPSLTNFSTINNKNVDSCIGGNIIETRYDKVRVIISKIKKTNEIKYKIDCTDFTFSKTYGGEFYHQDKAIKALYDVSLYGVAYNMATDGIDSWSSVSIDLTKSPFVLDCCAQPKEFGNCGKISEITRSGKGRQKLQFKGQGTVGGATVSSNSENLVITDSCTARFKWQSLKDIPIIKLNILNY